MFDHAAWRQECYEGYLLGLDDEEELDDEEFWVDPEQERYQADIDDCETPTGELARMADEVEPDQPAVPPSPQRP